MKRTEQPAALPPFRTVREVLDAAFRLHSRSRIAFAEASKRCDAARRRAVLAFLAEREADFLTTVARMRTGDDETLECFIQNVPAEALDAALASGDVSGDLDAVITDYSTRDAALLRFYSMLADAVGPRAEQVFHGLRDMIEQNQKRLRTALLDF